MSASPIHLLHTLLLCLLLMPLSSQAAASPLADVTEKLGKLETELAVHKAESKGELDKVQLATNKDLQKQGQQLKDFAERQADFAGRLSAQDAHIDNNLTTVGIVFGSLSAVLTIAGIFGFISLRNRARDEARTAATEWFGERAKQHEQQLNELQRQLETASEQMQALKDQEAQLQSGLVALHERLGSAQAEVDACASAAIDGIGEKTADFDRALAEAQQNLSAGKHVTQAARLAVLQAGQNSKDKSPAQQSWQDWNNRAFAAYANGDLDDAIQYWNELVTREDAPNGQVAQALFNKGVTLAQQGDSKGALACYDELLRRFTDTDEPSLCEQVAKALFNKGVTLAQQGDSKGALACYDELLRRFTDTDEPSLREQVAKALLNKAVTLRRHGDSKEALACYDELLHRFAEADEPALREQVAKVLFNKGATLGQQGNSKEALACYDELLHRFSDAKDPVLLQSCSWARNGKGFTLLCQAKQHWVDQLLRQEHLQQAAELFKAALEYLRTDDDRGVVLGNQSYCAHLLGTPSEEWVRERLKQGLRLHGEPLYKCTLDDLAIHPVAEKDKPFRQLLDEVWQEVQAEMIEI